MEKTKILDIGCGTGEFSRNLQKKKNALIWGIDINKENIKVCREKNPFGKYFVLPAEKINFEENFFDEVYMNEVMEHVNDTKKVIKIIKKILKPKGIFVISVPLRKSELKLAKENSDYFKQIGHRRVFSKRMFKNLLEKNNFDILKYRSYNSSEYLYWRIYFHFGGGIKNQNAKRNKNFVLLNIIKELLNQDNFYVYKRPSIKNYLILFVKYLFFPISIFLDILFTNKKQKIICKNEK